MGNKYYNVLRRIALDGALDEKTAEYLVDAGKWDASQHPREKDGKFAPKGSGSAGGSGSGGKKESKKEIMAETPKSKKASSKANEPPVMKEAPQQDPNSMQSQPEFNYADMYKLQTGQELKNANKEAHSAYEKQKNREDMRKSNMEQADKCFEEAKKWPEGSHERDVYNMYSEILSKPLSGRPSPEKSKATTEKFLGNISSQLKPYAVERYKKDLANEPQITNDICDVAEGLGTDMFGLDYRLKKASDNDQGVCRIAEKIQQDMDEAAKRGKPLSYEQAVDNLGDLVRYTQACTADNLENNANKTLKALEKKGYEVVKVKNTWESYNEKNPYRGVNCSLVSPTGTKFELQFHTAESLVCKEVQHGWYEEARTENTPQPRKDELNKRMFENAKSMKTPKNIGQLKSFKKE